MSVLSQTLSSWTRAEIFLTAMGALGNEMTGAFTESTVERAALVWLEIAGWSVRQGPDIAPDTLTAERSDYSQVVLEQRPCTARVRFNPALPAEALEDAFRKLTRPEGPTLTNRTSSITTRSASTRRTARRRLCA